ncbi:metallopeptidase TldD-related protein [Desulfosarcina sp.]|nr:metallopeptidase TldD-related protein [Desulfosarcina sp.]
MNNSELTSCALPDKLETFFPLMQDLVTIIERGLEDRVYAFAVLEDVNQFNIHVTTTESTGTKVDRGLVLRAFAGGKNFEYATNVFDKKSLIDSAQRLRSDALEHLDKSPTIKYSPVFWSEEPLDDFEPAIKTQILHAGNGSLPTTTTHVHFGSYFDSTQIETHDKGATAKRAKKFRNYLEKTGTDKISTTGVVIQRKTDSRLFVDRTRIMSQSLLSSLYYLYVVSRKGKTVQQVIGGMAGAEVSREITKKFMQNIIATAISLDNAPKISPGRYRIITGPDVTGVIAHEAFGHTQEGDTCRLGRSCAPRLRKHMSRIGNKYATIINNAGVFEMGKTPWGVNGTHFFDDEGFLARRQIILSEGYLSSPMNDLIASVVGDMNGLGARQSNGKRENWRRPLMSRQTNTYFTEGDKTLEELIRLCGDGYIAEFAHGGMEDPKGMGLTAGAEYFEQIKDGKRTGNLFLGPQGGHIELSDPVPRLLASIVAKSMIEVDGSLSKGEPYNKWGGCGKYHKELVAAGSGGPWILWDRITCG